MTSDSIIQINLCVLNKREIGRVFNVPSTTTAYKNDTEHRKEREQTLEKLGNEANVNIHSE